MSFFPRSVIHIAGEVRLPCWRFYRCEKCALTLDSGIHSPFLCFCVRSSLNFSIVFIWRCLEKCSISRWFRQARQTLVTVCGRMAKTARCCSPMLSRRQTHDGTMGSKLPRHHCFCLRTLRRSPLWFLHVLLFASACCCPSSWPDTASFRSCLLLPPGLLDTLEAGICARSFA